MRVPFKRHTDHNFVSQIMKRLMKNWKDRLFLTRISLLTDSSHRQTEQARRLRDSRAYFGVKSAASSARLCAAVGSLRRGSTRLGWNVRHASWAIPAARYGFCPQPVGSKSDLRGICLASHTYSLKI